jgi:hypothetical protein
MKPYPVEIEKGIPIPPRSERRERAVKKPPSPWTSVLKLMEVGDSFIVPGRRAATISVAARRLGYEIHTALQKFSVEDHESRVHGRSRAVRIWLRSKGGSDANE